MTEKRSVRVSPEADDFAARYDRMVAKGSGAWVVKALIGLVLLLVVLGVVTNLI